MSAGDDSHPGELAAAEDSPPAASEPGMSIGSSVVASPDGGTWMKMYLRYKRELHRPPAVWQLYHHIEKAITYGVAAC